METNIKRAAATAAESIPARSEWETIGYMTAARGPILAVVTWFRQRPNAAPRKLSVRQGFDRVQVAMAGGRCVVFEARGLLPDAAQTVFEERLKLLDADGFAVDFAFPMLNFDLDCTVQ